MNIPLDTTTTTTKITDWKTDRILGTHNGDDFKATRTVTGEWVAFVHAHGNHSYSGDGDTWGAAVNAASDTLKTAVTRVGSYS